MWTSFVWKCHKLRARQAIRTDHHKFLQTQTCILCEENSAPLAEIQICFSNNVLSVIQEHDNFFRFNYSILFNYIM